jgi:hypothetical protein
MSLRLLGLPLSFLATTGVALAGGGAPLCTANDPTGTPLNLRLSPNGPVVGTARNGSELLVIKRLEVDGTLWALVEQFEVGVLEAEFQTAWVFGEHLDCESPPDILPADPRSTGAGSILCRVDDPTGTPLNARTLPGGEIFAILRDGTVVRALAWRMHEGKPRIHVETWAGDNPAGWVVDADMACSDHESH